MSAVQKLYDICKTAFASSERYPSAIAIQRVRSVIEKIKCTDVGLREDTLEQHEHGFGFFGANGQGGRHSMVARWAPPISYLHIHEEERFSMGIFCLPTSAAIPLHNHPDMTVFSKLLYGSMHVKAYDWIYARDQEFNANSSEARLAKLAVDHVMTAPCETAILYPTSGGNMHAFTAITPCAVLDVLAPPYSLEDGRNCTYYRDFPYTTYASCGSNLDQEEAECDDGKLAWLEEVKPPDDFVVQRGIYRGPEVVAL
ncbi:hypothetical protein O6H91_08G067500 [Diphasiastrum complanatum]|uniref:Uncharacterized protein n=2 Tax=Diphasiastrum complanatum TaxID=34168 RepID=A0ACC2CYT9_DIPCM|nr:hypothetical protein O6H91_08G067500 [Diphasiastrum complanatum]KAJ7547073.1 hypothetical protein O6H91_08G067500 [Diphasiastrum complanatum]